MEIALISSVRVSCVQIRASSYPIDDLRTWVPESPSYVYIQCHSTAGRSVSLVALSLEPI